MSDEDYRVRGTLRTSGYIRRRDKGERSVWAGFGGIKKSGTLPRSRRPDTTAASLPKYLRFCQLRDPVGTSTMGYTASA